MSATCCCVTVTTWVAYVRLTWSCLRKGWQGWLCSPCLSYSGTTGHLGRHLIRKGRSRGFQAHLVASHLLLSVGHSMSHDQAPSRGAGVDTPHPMEWESLLFSWRWNGREHIFPEKSTAVLCLLSFAKLTFSSLRFCFNMDPGSYLLLSLKQLWGISFCSVTFFCILLGISLAFLPSMIAQLPYHFNT